MIGEAIGEVANALKESDTMQPVSLQVGANKCQHVTLDLYDFSAHEISVHPISTTIRDEAESPLRDTDMTK